tara:strand:+ start:153 stop:296 length:144 start_codon:yes stop_codon:yes gene_type:complete
MLYYDFDIQADYGIRDTNVTQLADLKARLCSIDPTIFNQLLVEILKE